MDIKELRKKHGLSQQDLSDKTGIPRPRIAKWEEGKGNPKIEDYKLLDNFFRNISEEVPPGADIDAVHSRTVETEADLESRRSLERTLENLSEDKIRSTAIIERLVALLEENLSSRKQPKAEVPPPVLKGSIAEAESQLARTGRSGPFVIPTVKEDKKGKTNK